MVVQRVLFRVVLIVMGTKGDLYLQGVTGVASRKETDYSMRQKNAESGEFSMIQREEMLQTVWRATLLVALSVCVGITFNTLRPKGVSLFGWQPENAPTDTAGAGGDGIPSIGVDAAALHHKNGTALFVDARPEASFQKGHIQGAVNLPDARFDEMFESFFTAVEPDRLIITYCDGPGCPLARHLAEKLKEMGYNRVYHLVDGWGQWRDSGLPVEP